MPVSFRLLTEADVKAVLSMDDLIDAMASALQLFSSGRVTQPVRTIIPVDDEAFAGFMPAFVSATARSGEHASFGATGATSSTTALGAKIVTVFGGNHARGLPSHLASIVLLDPETGALQGLLDGRYITEARTAAVSAVSSRLLARKTAASLAIIGSGVQARSHLDALSRIHSLRQVTVWSPQKSHRDRFVDWAKSATGSVAAADHAGEAVVGADIVVLVTSSPTPVLEDGWVKPGAHVISVGACRPNQREMDPALVARARLFVDSRAAALVESGDIVLGMQEQRFGADHIVAELGELVAGAPARRSDTEVTIFKSLGLAVEDVTAADLAYRRAVERGVGAMLTL
jgi:ornithine cyclodeaminase/alanine dehydrogenase-like protein (mu-crystallin family)